jgi:hypothetical protein
VVGYTTEEVVIVEVDGEAFLRRTQVLKADSIGSMHGISTIFKSTFQPISYASFFDGNTVEVKYHGDRASVTTNLDTNDFILDKPIFENHSVEMIIRLLPMVVGYKAQINVFHPRTKK